MAFMRVKPELDKKNTVILPWKIDEMKNNNILLAKFLSKLMNTL